MITFILIACLVALLVLISASKKKADTMNRMEARLDEMASASGVRTGMEVSERVMQLAENGDYLEALKQYRSETGCSLERAKLAVDPLMKC